MDQHSAVIPKVALLVNKSGESSPVAEIETGDRGDFSIDLPDGKYVIRFNRPGFSPVRMAATVEKGGRGLWAGLNVTMKVSDCGLEP